MHYIGHGSPEQMADEAVFRIEDVASLQNADRLPLFLAFSCDVAIFDDPKSKSMTEQMVLEPAGGAIAGIAATQVTFISPNEDLTETFYALLYPQPQVSRSEPIGRALMLAKNGTPDNSTTFVQHNNQKYHLLGDPAIQLQSPLSSIDLAGSLVDAIGSGQSLDLEATLVDGTEPRTGVSGQYFVQAKESPDSTVYLIPRSETITIELPYVIDGNSFYEGTGTFEDGTLDLGSHCTASHWSSAITVAYEC